jgi:hypothetical protein
MRIRINDYMVIMSINSTGLILVHRPLDHVKYRALLQAQMWRKQNLTPGTTPKKAA